MSQAMTPCLISSDAAATIEFYKHAFGAEEISRHTEPKGTRIMYARLRIFDSELMLSDDFSDRMGGSPQTPAALGGSPVTLHLDVPDANALWNQAVAAGATITMPLKDQFWGERYGQLRDPFGHKWSIGQTLKKISDEELKEGATEAFRD